MTDCEAPDKFPGCQVYVDAPLAVSVVELFGHTTLFPLTVIVGIGLTVTVIVAVFVHPAAEVPVTVYVVVDAGVTVADAVEIFPGIQLYVEAPLAVSVVEDPAQIEFVPVAVTVGSAFTVTVIVAVFVHPAAEVPVTVYVVVEAGVTLKVEPL